jgi:hypothetical protein
MVFYLDTEFNGWNGKLLSLALVSRAGALYLMSDDFHEGNDNLIPWVRENVLPFRLSCPVAPIILKREDWATIIAQFLWMTSPTEGCIIRADWPLDISHFCQSITYDDKMKNTPQLTFELRRYSSWPNDIKDAVRHNAYWDAYADMIASEKIAV